MQRIKKMIDTKQPMIKFHYTGSIAAKDLGVYFNSLNNEFKTFVKDNNYQDIFSDQISIKEIKHGSLEIFPVLEYVASALPLIDQTEIIIDFFKFISSGLKLLEQMPDKVDYSQKKLSNFKGLNGLSVAGDGNVINYNIINNYGTPNEKIETLSSFDKIKSLKIEENINKKLLEYKKVENTVSKAVVFYWDTARFNKSKPFNYKGICRNISPNPYNVIFDDDYIKNYMTRESHIDKPWQDLCYVVDIELTEGKSKPVYKITKIYEDQTFYQETEDNDKK